VFVGCSGSFRFDRAVKARHWQVKVHSNDVSLLSCALGSLATGSAFEIRFKERLGFLEDLVDPEDFRARTAAVMVALAMAKPGAGKALKPWPPSSLRARRRTFDDKYGPLKSGSTHHRGRDVRRLLAGG
jgi:hypothetical protein